MNDWRSLLRDADRGREAAMPAGDVQRMRRVVVSAARDAAVRRRPGWSRAFVVCATLLVMICGTVLAGLQRSTRTEGRWRSAEGEVGPVEGDEALERQQLQFTSPGGTRIIWVFDSQFEVKGSLP